MNAAITGYSEGGNLDIESTRMQEIVEEAGGKVDDYKKLWMERELGGQGGGETLVIERR